MTRDGVSADEMADRIGDCSASAVRKWAADERLPRAEQQRRIYEVTNGEVTPNDFVLDLPVEQSSEAAA